MDAKAEAYAVPLPTKNGLPNILKSILLWSPLILFYVSSTNFSISFGRAKQYSLYNILIFLLLYLVIAYPYLFLGFGYTVKNAVDWFISLTA
ncbi:MAG: hypothetical protein GX928_02710 [Ruminococcaceae bacterium]|nr:hypothetical protein [Oscillospiraceae bacterium]